MKKTHFGFKEINLEDKLDAVKGVFDSVADQYDFMNDLMSFGIHRCWKKEAIKLSCVKPDDVVLDLAAGSGDLSLLLAKRLNAGKLIVSDINKNMLAKAETKLIDAGVYDKVEFLVTDAQEITLADESVDLVTMSFGLRNVPEQQKALNDIYRVLKPGGRLLVLEFSKVQNPVFAKIYKNYNMNVLPLLGSLVTQDKESYRYLAESIEMHPSQEELKKMFYTAGFYKVHYQNLSNGIVAIHRGWKMT